MRSLVGRSVRLLDHYSTHGVLESTVVKLRHKVLVFDFSSDAHFVLVKVRVHLLCWRSKLSIVWTPVTIRCLDGFRDQIVLISRIKLVLGRLWSAWDIDLRVAHWAFDVDLFG